jgi:hypothetical protein
VKRISGNGLGLVALTVVALCVAGAPAAAKQPKGTNLLFTFVTNQAGFDTTLTIANTTQDPFGTTLIDGTCTFHFYGSSPPAPTETLVIAAGTVFTALASTLAPGFQGYVIAECNVPLLHGWAIVGDFGLENLGASYPALVIPAGKRKKLERLDE